MELVSGFVLVLVFGCVAALVFAVGSHTENRQTKQRLSRLSDNYDFDPAESGASAEEQGGVFGIVESLFGRFAARVAPEAEAEDEPKDSATRRRLIEAGYRRPSAIVIYSGLRFLLAIILPMVVISMAPMWNLDRLQLFTILGAAVVAGRMIPSQWVDRQRGIRQHKIIIGLPDALDLMVVCVEAGLGIMASLSRIGEESKRTNPILSEEFELVILEARAGKSTTEALRSFATRSGVSDVSSLVAMLVQTERFGTSLADTLRVQADSLRVMRMQRAEELAGKAPLKMMFPTLLIFAATLLVTLGPGLLQLMAFFEEIDR
jgi:tight adherence protein C